MKTKTPTEDPSIKAARDREERRADAAFIENASGLLDEQTRKKIRRFGSRPAAARVAGAGATGAGSGANPGSSGGGSYDPSTPTGGFGGDGGKFSDSVSAS